MTEYQFSPSLIEIGPFTDKKTLLDFKSAVKKMLNDVFRVPESNLPVETEPHDPLAGMCTSVFSSHRPGGEVVNGINSSDPEVFKIEILLPPTVDAQLFFATIERALEVDTPIFPGFDPTNIFAVLSIKTRDLVPEIPL